MTVDVEDYFQVQAFGGVIKRAQWDHLPSHVEVNTLRILKQFAEKGVQATFFTLGWVADRYPSIIKAIVAGGHELASHGYGHDLVHELTPQQFRDDVARAKHTLEAIGGVEVKGYRAPTFSIGPKTPWACHILFETGHRYSSSVYPIRHDLYGNPDAPRFVHHPVGGPFVEVPMTTFRLGTRNLPLSGGGFFRLLPYGIYRAALRQFCASEKKPGIFYIHPWEIDTEQPRVCGAGRRSMFRHYVNIGAVPRRLDCLLQDFRWGRMDQVFALELTSA